MPHVTVQLYPGKTEAQKQQLSREIVQLVMSTLGSREASISVAIEEVEPAQWAEKVYRPEILENEANVYVQPGYDPFA